MVSTLVLIYLGRPRLRHTKKQTLDISDCWSKDMLNFKFLVKGLELASPQDFVHNFF